MRDSMKEYVVKSIERLVNIPSPSGFTKEVMQFVQEEAEGLGYSCSYTNRGALIIDVKGSENETIGLSAHVDTICDMLRSIHSDCTLNLT